MLQRPGLVVLTGPPGCGRTTLLRRLSATVSGPVHAGGGLAMLQTVPALALSRAVKAKLPAYDVHLLAEAVRSRVRGGLLVIDDLHYTDPATLAALPLLAAHCRVLTAVRTPHRLPPATEAALRAAATAWIPVPPLTPAEAADLARRTAPHLDQATLTAVVDRAGGNPLAVTALARNAAAGARSAAGGATSPSGAAGSWPAGTSDPDSFRPAGGAGSRPASGGGDIDQVAYAIATALADLPRPARTALAALGLLGRPAPAALLGPGATDLQAAGLITAAPDGTLLPVSTYVAETAAGLLDAAARTDLHTRLAELTPPAEAARHLAAAGDPRGAHRQALLAADHTTGGDRAALLLFACELDTPIDPRVRLAAADALLSVGRPAAAARVLTFDDQLAYATGHRASDAAGQFDSVGTDPFSAELGFPHPPAERSGTDLDFTDSPAGRPGPNPPQPAGEPDSSPGLDSRSRAASGAARSVDVDALRSLRLEADVLRGEALLQAGNPEAARAAVRAVPDAASPLVMAGRDRVLLLAELATDPAAARDLADKIAARHPRPSAGVAAALAAVQAHFRTPGWDTALAAAATAGGDPLITRWSAWLLVEELAADGRLTESASVALRAARDSAADLAYGWQTRFAAAADWALALHGSTTDVAPTNTPADPTTAPGSGLAESPGPTNPPADPAKAGSAPAHAVPPEPIPADPASAPATTIRPYSPAAAPGPATTTPAFSATAGPAFAPTPPARGVGGQDGSRAADVVPPHERVTATADPGGAQAAGRHRGESATTSGSPAPTDHPRGLGHMRPGGIYGAATAPASTHPGDVVAELWDGTDGVLRRAANLTDRALPDEARGYATAATALIEADTGLLAAARAHLDGGPAHPAVSWVAQETAWLDGQPDRAVASGGDDDGGLLAGLRAITAQWAAHDLGSEATPVIAGGLPSAARRTLTAWATGTGFTAAADGWRPIALRERIRCLLAAGLTDTDPARAVEALLNAERLADAAGLTVLAGRARRGLRRHRVHRDTRGKRSGDQLTRRETDVLRLVAAGEPTRRIAGQLGISAETVDTHIRAGMRKLGARTRTEAAALAFARPDTSDKDGR
ncbi:LuxR C-terminal-related transcriptional regulator [Actinoplanes sp. NPDC048988]|uniref:LuxR C-terminal-related transcriptional regulator n=1 Tax=Actinoplanes sp. NPDC048988 TaxID=3363901 RepID=UPI00371F4F30